MNNAMHWAGIVLAAATLTACQSAAERQAAQMAQCEQYGFQRGTDAFARCMQDLDQPARATPGVTFGLGIGIGR